MQDPAGRDAMCQMRVAPAAIAAVKMKSKDGLFKSG